MERIEGERVRQMTGEYRHSLDNKGRLFIPAKLREELGEVFYITLSMDRCLCVYSAESWQSFSEKVGAMPYVKQRRMRPLFAHAARCELDSQGRTIIPQNLRTYASLTKNVTVVTGEGAEHVGDFVGGGFLSDEMIVYGPPFDQPTNYELVDCTME